MRFLPITLLIALLLAACGQSNVQPATQPEATPDASENVQQVEERPANVTPQELAVWLEETDRPFLLDVREPFETEIATIPGTNANIPLGELSARLDELDSSEEIVVYCRSGSRSSSAMRMLESAGFTDVHNLTGGTNGWAEQVDPSMTSY
jgi:adenylyltransferase/sulfurtransferase